MLLSLLTPSIKFALNNHFFIIIDTIIDAGKCPGIENSGGKKSGGEKSSGENSGGENSGGENSVCEDCEVMMMHLILSSCNLKL